MTDQSFPRAGTRPPFRSLDAERSARLVELLKDESLSRNQIAERVPCGLATVTRWAAQHGRTFDRSASAAAAAARVIDGRARRLAVAEGLTADIEDERTVRRGYTEPRDRADSARSIAGLAKAVTDLVRLDIDQRRLDAAEALMTGSDVEEFFRDRKAKALASLQGTPTTPPEVPDAD